jgi:type I restriction enzyme, R subunit
MEPSAFGFAERHDNIEAIYKKLTERRDTADVTESAQGTPPDRQRGHPRSAPGEDQSEGLTFDLSKIDFDKLRDEFAKKVRARRGLAGHPRNRRSEAGRDARPQPARMDYYRRNTRRSSPTTTAKRTG